VEYKLMRFGKCRDLLSTSTSYTNRP